MLKLWVWLLLLLLYGGGLVGGLGTLRGWGTVCYRDSVGCWSTALIVEANILYLICRLPRLLDRALVLHLLSLLRLQQLQLLVQLELGQQLRLLLLLSPLLQCISRRRHIA